MTNASRPRRRPKGAEGPLTKAMCEVLRQAAKRADGAIALPRTAQRAFVQSLVARGLIRAFGSIFVITDAGREAAKGKP